MPFNVFEALVNVLGDVLVVAQLSAAGGAFVLLGSNDGILQLCRLQEGATRQRRRKCRETTNAQSDNKKEDLLHGGGDDDSLWWSMLFFKRILKAVQSVVRVVVAILWSPRREKKEVRFYLPVLRVDRGSQQRRVGPITIEVSNG